MLLCLLSKNQNPMPKLGLQKGLSNEEEKMLKQRNDAEELRREEKTLEKKVCNETM